MRKTRSSISEEEQILIIKKTETFNVKTQNSEVRQLEQYSKNIQQQRSPDLPHL